MQCFLYAKHNFLVFLWFCGEIWLGQVFLRISVPGLLYILQCTDVRNLFDEVGCSITGVGSVLHRSSQEHKLICTSSLIVPAHSVAWENVCRTIHGPSALPLQSIVLPPALYKCKDGILLFRGRQSLKKNRNNIHI